jgi:HlyD family secretion protein
MSTQAEQHAHGGMDRKITRNRKKPRIVVLVAAASVAAIIYFWATFDSSTSFTLDGQRIRIAEVSTGVYEDYIPLRATVEPERTVYLDAIEGGRVEAVFVEEGAVVEIGDPIVELSNTSLQLDVIAREAEVSEQLNNLRNTQLAIEQNRLSLKKDLIEIDYQVVRLTRLVQRYEELEGNQFISKNEYDNSRDELEYWQNRRVVTKESQVQDEKIRLVQIEQLNGSVEQLEKNLLLARGTLDDLLIRAPRAGKLTSLNAEIGESKSRGQRLGQIDDVDKFKASSMVNEFYLNRVRTGQQALLSVDGDDYRLEVSKVYPEVQSAQFEVDLRFVDSAPKDIRRGQTLKLRLVLGDTTESAILLASGPFFNDTGGAWVFVLDADGKVARRRTVQFGRRNPNNIEVDAGLVAGDKVIVSSYASFIEVERLFIER